jgi:hypothetical protein
VTWTRLWLRAWSWAEWPCPNCGALLGFDGRRRFAVGLVAGAFMGAGLGLLLRGHDWSGLICLVLAFWVWTFDRVECRGESVVHHGRPGSLVPRG